MNASTEGFVDILRHALRASDKPLSLDDILAGIVHDVGRSELSDIRRGMQTVVRQRITAGEVLRHHNPTGVLTYSLNPDHVLRQRRRANPPKAKEAVKAAAPVDHAVPTAPEPQASPMAIKPLTVVLRPSAQEHACFGRLQAICTDLEDLIGEACDARLDHAFIKALMVSQSAAHRAIRASGHAE